MKKILVIAISLFLPIIALTQDNLRNETAITPYIFPKNQALFERSEAR